MTFSASQFCGAVCSAVRSRAQRARVLRSYMIHDSLTGLYNHSATKDFLEMEFTRVRRKRW